MNPNKCNIWVNFIPPCYSKITIEFTDKVNVVTRGMIKKKKKLLEQSIYMYYENFQYVARAVATSSHVPQYFS